MSNFNRGLLGLLIGGSILAIVLWLEPGWMRFCDRHVLLNSGEVTKESDAHRSRSLSEVLEKNIKNSRQVWNKAEANFTEGEIVEGATHLIEGELEYFRSGAAKEVVQAQADDIFNTVQIEWIDRLKGWRPFVSVARYQLRSYGTLMGIASLFLVAFIPSGLPTQKNSVKLITAVLLPYGLASGPVTAFALSTSWSTVPTLLLTLGGAMGGVIVTLLSAMVLTAVILGAGALEE